MFRGMFEHSIDAKGRTSLPARFREVLANDPSEHDDEEDVERSSKFNKPTLIVTTSIERCLVAYPLHEWRAFEAKLAALPQFDPAVVQLKRIYVAGATECTVDRHGRLQLPPMLREYARLQRELVWAGMVTTIEIWAKEAWADQVQTSRSDPLAISKALTELGL